MNRAASGEPWLRDGRGAGSFLVQIGEACSVFPVDLHAYCLLPRHYHLLVRAEVDPLKAALAHLEAASGFPRADPPRAVPVGFRRHLTSVSRYIHLNPVDAGLVWCPEHWIYSSFRGYLGDLSAPGFLLTEAVLGRFGTIGARHRHRAYVYAGMDPGTRDLDGRPRWTSFFHPGTASEDLAWRIEPVLTRNGRSRESPVAGVSLHRLARAIAEAFEVSTEALRSVRRGGPAAAVARGALIHAARAQGHRRLREVAAFVGYASPAVTAAAAERFDRALRLDRGLASRLDGAVGAATSLS
jgi:hypothetical protein